MNNKIDGDLKIAISGILILLSVAFISFKSSALTTPIISLNVVALIAGIIFQARQLSKNWTALLLTVFFTLLVSFITMMPSKNEVVYNLEKHLNHFPYWFMGLFSLMFYISNEEKIVVKLTEGITLLQSIVVIY